MREETVCLLVCAGAFMSFSFLRGLFFSFFWAVFACMFVRRPPLITRPFFIGTEGGGFGSGGGGVGRVLSRCSDSGAEKNCSGSAREDTLHNDIYPVLAALQPTKAIYTYIDHSLLFY